ncbi:hypothetical protein SDC9_180841 [bioreactor metagenome]|uniref:Uncharacterized protein n=1 Tax=bioreactor metagenome TaxID=1076179 RepID=A0A645H2V2_9ZZZZ
MKTGADGGHQFDVIVQRGEAFCDIVPDAADADLHAAEVAVPLAADAVRLSGDVDGRAADDVDGIHRNSFVGVIV